MLVNALDSPEPRRSKRNAAQVSVVAHARLGLGEGPRTACGTRAFSCLSSDPYRIPMPHGRALSALSPLSRQSWPDRWIGAVCGAIRTGRATGSTRPV